MPIGAQLSGNFLLVLETRHFISPQMLGWHFVLSVHICAHAQKDAAFGCSSFPVGRLEHFRDWDIYLYILTLGLFSLSLKFFASNYSTLLTILHSIHKQNIRCLYILCIILVSHHFDVNVHLQILAKSFQQFLVHVCKHFSMFMYHWQSTTHHSRTACSAVCWQAIPTAIFTAAPTTAAYKHWDQQPLTRQYPGEPSQPSTVTSSDQRWDAMMQKLQSMKALLQTQQQPIIQIQNNAVPLHPLCSPQCQTMYSRSPLHRVMSNPKPCLLDNVRLSSRWWWVVSGYSCLQILDLW